MNRMEEIIDEMAGYVCDKICRHRIGDSLDQERLDEICAECDMGDHVCNVLNEYNRVTENKSRREPPSWKDRVMDRFLLIY